MTELALIVKATIILAVALVATRIACNAKASVRSLILAAAFGLVLILPVASAVVPSRELAIPSNYAPAFLLEELNPPATVASAPVRMPDASRPEWRFPSAASLTRLTWLLGALATVAPLLIGLWRVRGLRNRSRAWAEGRAFADALRAAVGVRRVVAVAVHDELSAPMTCGWLRPAIVMPADALKWPVNEIRQALVHELEHVRRHDWPVHVVARITCALYWFHPAAWIAWRQLRLESERACDDAVVTHAEDVAYASQLVALARRFGTTTAPLLSMADRRTLATRVAAILNRNIARGRVGIGSAAAITLGAAALSALISPLHAVVRAAAVQTPSPATRSFEVASIRQNTSGQPGQTIALQGNTFVARNVTARELVMTAFRVRSEDLSGGPGWLDSERYDVSGRPQNEANWDEHLLMLQRLLADRFKLSIRRETRPTPVYALVVGRNGSRLTPAADPNCTASVSSGPKCGGFATRPGFVNGRRVTVAQVASLLSGRSGRLVLDRTGITGAFDVTLSWTPDASQLPPGLPPDGVPPFDPSGPSLFAAIQEQLGLRLEPTTSEIDHFVIEHIERPTPNDAPEPTATAPPPMLSPLQAAAPPTPGGFQFDAASVRRRTDPGGGFMGVRPGGRFTAEGVSLQDLIVFSYLVQPYQIVDGPGWLDVERWDVNATGATGTRNDVLLALQRLLTDRFSLVIRRDVRELPIYALVVARGDGRLGPQLKPSAVDCAAMRAEAQKTGVIPPDAPRLCVAEGRLGSVRIGGAPLADLAPMLSTRVQRMVVDRTGLTGTWDLTLTYAPDPAQIPPGPLFPGLSFDPNGPELSTAIQEQLGLRLEATRAPVDVLVIEQAGFAREN
jgi:uncharacterized protein (TIGR03435 family)